MGVLGRADCHCGEVKTRYWVGGDGGGDGRLLPVGVGTMDQIGSTSETKADDKEPTKLANFSLRHTMVMYELTT